MNPPIERPDSALRAWLELGPERGRPEALERALAATRRVPQRPSWTFPERWLPVNRVLLAAAAALIIVVGGAAFILRPASNNVGPSGSPAPTATSTPTSQPTLSSGQVPAELMRTWVGVPHPFPGAPPVDDLQFRFEFGQLIVNVNYSKDMFESPVTVTGADTLELTALSNGCDLNLVGHYTWSLSPRGTLLHLTAVDDACAARSAALAGDWHAAGCKDTTDVCWGDLEAGTYPTLFYGPRLDPSETPRPLYGAVTFTVPDGWAVAGDHTSDVRLLRSSDYAKEGPSGPVGQPTGIEAWIRPAANVPDHGCNVAPAPGVGHTPEALATWLHGLPGLVTSPVQDITIDGHAGRWVDVSVAPSWTQTCGGSAPTLPLITEAIGSAGSVGDGGELIGISGQAHLRLIFIDIGKSDRGTSMTAMILVTAPDKATFDSFVNEAMPIVESFHFK